MRTLKQLRLGQGFHIEETIRWFSEA